MHEMSLMSGILARASEALAPYRVKQVTSITVEVGVLANILPAAFEFAFESLSAESVLTGAKLVCQTKPIKAHCLECDSEFCSESLFLACPDCQSKRIRIISGDEVFLTGIDFEEEGEADED